MNPALRFGACQSLRNQTRLSLHNSYADSDRPILGSTFQHVDKEDGKTYEPPPRQLADRNRAKKTRLRAFLARRVRMHGCLVRENSKARAFVVKNVVGLFS